jgi:EAL domain-containing protein (putative c-di-GMP-specific phosphodiesterase class I)
MSFPILDSYLNQLRRQNINADKLWIDSHDRVQGKFRNCSLTSVFSPIVSLDGDNLLGFEAHSHSYAGSDRGLSVWQLLMNAADDDESIELDRLARMIHVMNFFRQPEHKNKTLFIDVHDRLLTAVSNNHGAAFKRIVTGLGLSSSRIVLQLPHVKPKQQWALTQVVENYKLNGFPVATRATDIDEAHNQAETLRPSFIRLDINRLGNGYGLDKLIRRIQSLSVKLLISRVEFLGELKLLHEISAGLPTSTDFLFIQGSLFSDAQPNLYHVSSGSWNQVLHQAKTYKLQHSQYKLSEISSLASF